MRGEPFPPDNIDTSWNKVPECWFIFREGDSWHMKRDEEYVSRRVIEVSLRVGQSCRDERDQ